MRQLLLTIGVLVFTTSVQSAGLDIYAAEIGVAKFHRMDNKAHKYAADNIWAKFILPDNVYMNLTDTLVQNNADGSISIFFTNLEDLLVTVAKQAVARNQSVNSLSINTHGMPGGLWFPMDKTQMRSMACRSWVDAAQAPDEVNYKQYYTPLRKSEIMSLRAASQNPSNYGCVSGPNAWKNVVSRHPEIQTVFTDLSQINMMACLVGLGPAGEIFSGTIASLLLSDRDAQIKTSLNFGLGDWSMPEGLGFWDYMNDRQLSHDNSVYPKNRMDREIMQKGVVRVTSFAKGKASSALVADQVFLKVGPLDTSMAGRDAYRTSIMNQRISVPSPSAVRIPGTGVSVFRVD